jgi:hypothetical protein
MRNPGYSSADTQTYGCLHSPGNAQDAVRGAGSCPCRREHGETLPACGPKCLQQALRRFGIEVGLEELLR